MSQFAVPLSTTERTLAWAGPNFPIIDHRSTPYKSVAYR